MKYYYDLHIHTALSPCGDEDMTPSNIVAMASLKGLDIIAVTDHNSAGNAAAVTEAAKRAGQGLVVIPGMEVTTDEDIHVVMLFPSVRDALNAEAELFKTQVKIPNKPEIFGRQLLMSHSDEVIGEKEFLLIPATGVSFENCVGFAEEFGGVSFPAHIDKPSNAVIAILGRFPPDTGFRTVELSPRADVGYLEQNALSGMRYLVNSDAHYLEDILERENNFLELSTLSANAVLSAVKKGR